MKNIKPASVTIILITLALSFVCYTILPDPVIVQRNFEGVAVSTMPKIVAVIIPFGMCFASTLLYNKRNDIRFFIASLAGILILVVTLLTN